MRFGLLKGRRALTMAVLMTCAVGLVLAACGGDDDKDKSTAASGGDSLKDAPKETPKSTAKKVAADEWVKNICGFASTFQSVQDKQEANLAKVDTKNPKAAKDSFVKAFDAFGVGLADFRKGFEGAGQPDVDGGDQILVVFTGKFDDSQKQLKDLQQKFGALPTDSQASFEKALNAIPDAPKYHLRDKLKEVANSKKDAAKVVDKFDADAKCAKTLYSDDEQSASSQPTAAPTRQVANPTPSNAGSGKAISVQQWSSNFCTAFSTWDADIQKLSNSINFNNSSDAAQVKTLMVKFLQDATDRTVRLQRDLGSDFPQVKDGPAIQAAFVSGASTAASLFAAATKDASALDTRDTAKFASDLTKLGNAISDASSDVEKVFSDIDKKYDTVEISKVAAGLPACKGLF